MHTTVDEFLAEAPEYHLGGLETESPHPLTVNLSRLAENDLAEAISALHGVDRLALESFEDRAAALPGLAQSIHDTLEGGGRIFLCGCGATGRLSLSLEIFSRTGVLPAEFNGRVTGFMAGGDLALIRAIEKFEDRPDFGARQLVDLGFTKNDLLISSTEGGETPFVIGATEHAAEISGRRPWFLYCNPDLVLAEAAERSRRVLENPGISKLNLAVGPMGLTGSTRMQASTVLMAAIGFAMRHHSSPGQAPAEAARLHRRLKNADFEFLRPFIRHEAEIYRRNEYVFYEAAEYGITVVTDTTERSPTFSLVPFENQNQPEEPASWCHFLLPGATDSEQAWRRLLGRSPYPLSWPEVRAEAGLERLMGYDFSEKLPSLRHKRTGNAPHWTFRISDRLEGIALELGDLKHTLPLEETALFERHLFLKMALNIHSTLVMGQLGRYIDNLMTYVRPSNNKLIDRAIRYVHLLLKPRMTQVPSYEAVARRLFSEIDRLPPGEPIVPAVARSFLRETGK